MHTVIPLGERICCKRRAVGEKIGKAGIIVVTENTAERSTDLADVIYVPSEIKDIKAGDTIILAAYHGVDFIDSETQQKVTIVNYTDVIGKVVNNGR